MNGNMEGVRSANESIRSGFDAYLMKPTHCPSMSTIIRFSSRQCFDYFLDVYCKGIKVNSFHYLQLQSEVAAGNIVRGVGLVSGGALINSYPLHPDPRQ